jgi:single-strand DNA-binding protein
MQAIPITVIGNLVRDPEQKGSGATVTSMRIASTERVNDNGQWRDGDTAYFNVACFKTLGDNVMSSLKKGDKVVVNGKLKYREFERKNGDKGHDYEIIANEIGLSLSKRPKIATTTVEMPAKESAWS